VTPSGIHTDTGLLTCITCAKVPGLQVLDRESGKFLAVETMVQPGKDLFMIMGRKMQVLCQQGSDQSVFIPTVHRVVLPPDTERSSLLYFQDVGQI